MVDPHQKLRAAILEFQGSVPQAKAPGLLERLLDFLLGLLGPHSGGGVAPSEPDEPPAHREPSRVTRIVARVSNIMPPRRVDDPSTPEDDRVPRSFLVDASGQIHFTDGTDSLDDGSIVSVEMDVFDQYGEGMRIDLDPSKTPAGQTNHPELLGRFRFEALTPDGKKVLGAIGGNGLADSAHVEGEVHWLDPDPSKGPGAWRRSGGVWAQCAVRQRCAFVISCGGTQSNAITTPEVR